MDTTAIRHGAQLHSKGRLDEAEAVYTPLLQGDLQQAATAHYLLGLLRTDRADPLGALSHYDAAIARGAASGDLFFRRGEALRTLQRLEAAVESFDRAIALEPDTKTYWNHRGIALEALDRIGEAVASYDRALALDPDYVQARHNRGSALLKAQRWEEAVASFNQVLARSVDIPETWAFHAVALASLNLNAEALESADRAIALRPHYPEAHNTRSIALRALKQPQAALAAADAALAARPAFPEALNSKGSALIRLNRYEEARDAYRVALSMKGEDAGMRLNLGMALEALGDLDGALAAFTASDALAPSLPDARFAKGLVHIRSGEIREGFRLYETRWTQKGGPRHSHPQETLWLGEEPLGDRRLLIHAEQGLGDVIQFCRFAARAGPAARIVLQVQPPLVRLLSTLKGVGQVCSTEGAVEDFDVHIPIMSLPLALDLGLPDLATDTPYLHAAPVAVEDWRRRLPPTAGPRVGLAWSGNPGHDNDHNRSMTLEALRPLLDADAQFISLQKAPRAEERAALDGLPGVLRFEADLHDFADTAALVSCCDVVIAVDTAVAHLAGALGKPLWLMLPRFCDWRWMNHRPDSPWYPSAQLFRQTAFGDWTSVIDAVAARLQAYPRPERG